MKLNLEKDTKSNNFYRKVIETTPQIQLVLMSLEPGIEIGREKHTHTTQFIRVESGKGVAYIGNERFNLKDGDAVVIPPNVYHNIKATTELKLYTIYSPPEHPKHKKEYTKK